MRSRRDNLRWPLGIVVAKGIASIDLFVVPTIAFQQVFATSSKARSRRSAISPCVARVVSSDKPLTIYHSGVFAEFLARFMREIGVPKAALIGQSMGAGVALEMAVKYPQLVDRIVLVNGGGFRSANDAPRAGAPDWHARQISNAGTLAESREYLEKMYYNHSLITDKLVEDNLILRLRSAYTAEAVQTANARGLGGVTEHEVRGIKTPTLLVWGANDNTNPQIG